MTRPFLERDFPLLKQIGKTKVNNHLVNKAKHRKAHQASHWLTPGSPKASKAGTLDILRILSHKVKIPHDAQAAFLLPAQARFCPRY
jgi:hypothetical protein